MPDMNLHNFLMGLSDGDQILIKQNCRRQVVLYSSCQRDWLVRLGLNHSILYSSISPYNTIELASISQWEHQLKCDAYRAVK